METSDRNGGQHVSEELAAYLDRELPADQKTEVEAHLAECSGCAELLESMKNTGKTVEQAVRFARRDHFAVERLEAYRLKETAKEDTRVIATHLRLCSHCREALANLSFLEETEAARQVVPTRRPQWLSLRYAAVAAAVMVVIGFAAWQMLRRVEPDRKDLLARLSRIEPPLYLESQPPAGTLDRAASEELRNGMQAYRAGRYQEAIGHLAPLVEQHPDSQQAMFFLAACYLLTEQPSPAISLLERLLREPGPYAERAHWYLGKAYLRTGDLARARSELEEVATMEGRYRDEARFILEELRRLQ